MMMVVLLVFGTWRQKHCVPNASSPMSIHFRRMLHRYFRSQWSIPPTAVASAFALMRHDDDYVTSIVCWWIAYKFDTGYMFPCADILQDFPMVTSKRQLLTTECAVLTRNDFHICRDTIVSRIYDLGPENVDKSYDDWLHTLLDHDIIFLFSPEEWVRVLNNLLSRTQIPTIIQALSYNLNKRTRKRLLPTSPRLIHKKRRAVIHIE